MKGLMKRSIAGLIVLGLGLILGCNGSGGLGGGGEDPVDDIFGGSGGSCGIDPTGDWQVFFTPVTDACGLGSHTDHVSAILAGSEVYVNELEDSGACETTTYQCNGARLTVSEEYSYPVSATCAVRVRSTGVYDFSSNSSLEGQQVNQLSYEGDCSAICGASCGSCTSTHSATGMQGGPGALCP